MKRVNAFLYWSFHRKTCVIWSVGICNCGFRHGQVFRSATAVGNPGAPIETRTVAAILPGDGHPPVSWQFIGLSQVIGGGLLMTAVSKLRAAIFFRSDPQHIYHHGFVWFQGTPVVTGLMLLATVFAFLGFEFVSICFNSTPHGNDCSC